MFGGCVGVFARTESETTCMLLVCEVGAVVWTGKFVLCVHKGLVYINDICYK